MGRSKTGSGLPGDSAAALNALILSVIKALCLLFGVVGRADKDCDLFRATGTSVASSRCNNLVSIDGKLSSAGETHERDGLEFRRSSWSSIDTRLRNGDTSGTGSEARCLTGLCRSATIVNPRGRLEPLPVAGGLSGMVVGKRGATSS